jgi:hypothetical protein
MSNRAIQSGTNVMDNKAKDIVNTTTRGNPDAIADDEAQAQVLNKGMSEVPAASTGEVDPAQAAGEVAGTEESGETKGSAEESQQERTARLIEAFLQREQEKSQVEGRSMEGPADVARETDLLAQKDEIQAKANERIASLQAREAELDAQAAKLLEEGETEKYHTVNKQMQQLYRDIAREETNAQTQQMYIDMEIREQKANLERQAEDARKSFIAEHPDITEWYQTRGQQWMQDPRNQAISNGNPVVGYLQDKSVAQNQQISELSTRLKELEQKYNNAIESEAKDPNKMVGAGSGGKPPTQQIEGKSMSPQERMVMAMRKAREQAGTA